MSGEWCACVCVSVVSGVCVDGIPPRSLLALEQQHGLSGHVEEDEILGLVRDAHREVVADDAVPRGGGVGRIETLLDASGNILQDEANARQCNATQCKPNEAAMRTESVVTSASCS